MKNSYILYEGKSLIDNKTDIVLIATGFKTPSANEKTGGVIQTYILVGDEHPYYAWKNKRDYAVCGDCPHRGVKTGKRSCYVNLSKSVANVFKAYAKGVYSQLEDFSIFKNKIVRAGSYGEPTAVPSSIWSQIYKNSHKMTGYTHRWRDVNNVNHNGFKFSDFCMASVDTEKDYNDAIKAEWRTFRSKLEDEPLQKDEIYCANTLKGIQCYNCVLCSGNKIKAKNIVIDAHGCNIQTYKLNTGRKK